MLTKRRTLLILFIQTQAKWCKLTTSLDCGYRVLRWISSRNNWPTCHCYVFSTIKLHRKRIQLNYFMLRQAGPPTIELKCGYYWTALLEITMQFNQTWNRVELTQPSVVSQKICRSKTLPKCWQGGEPMLQTCYTFKQLFTSVDLYSSLKFILNTTSAMPLSRYANMHLTYFKCAQISIKISTWFLQFESAYCGCS